MTTKQKNVNKKNKIYENQYFTKKGPLSSDTNKTQNKQVSKR